ncbi:hypothetical protein FIBSPDRAFT_1048168 [Athelia psychrophila]|uniref:DUF6534 domain-containing protein n=1 Tax=Athelia psychrophila TaxID=1759441 RepID=A0A166E450_9AGAM|nr:hypothetical protein FIBSPDRAFT_1048168 [Fibularhizoctonia sp. CBS 109695]
MSSYGPLTIAPNQAAGGIASTYGALLVGGLVAAGLSGIVTVQSFVYVKLYPADRIHTKLIVAAVWLLDSCHTLFVCQSIWDYFITHFGDNSRITDIPTSLALTIAITAILTFVVHAFFAHRIFKLSKRNYFAMVPIAFLAVCRLAAACVTTSEMIRIGNLPEFVKQFSWVFTTGLALSSAVDVLIAGFLCYSLQNSRSSSSSMDHVINLLILYTFENGALTCAATVVSMICWLVMPDNRIFLGIHFVIVKIYANSLLATLNSRKKLQHERTRTTVTDDAMVPSFLTGIARPFKGSRRSEIPEKLAARRTILEINVVRTVDYAVDDVKDDELYSRTPSPVAADCAV